MTDTKLVHSTSATELRVRNGSVPFLQHDFEVPGIGGGVIVVNHYGDFLISIAEVDIGTIGDRWKTRDAALDDLHRNTNVTSNKCTATNLGIGGAGILLYIENDSPAHRKILWSRLAKELPTFTQTQIICLPGSHLETGDLLELEKANRILKGGGGGSNDEKKSDSDSDEHEEFPTLMKRSSSVSIMNENFEFPVPSSMISKEAIRNNVVEKAKAFSSLGALTTLLQAKEWNKVVLLGMTPVSFELFELLLKREFDVYMSDPKQGYVNASIPKNRILPWNGIFEPGNTHSWDVMVFCTREFCPILTADLIEEKIRGIAISVVSISDDFLPMDAEEREQSVIAFEKYNIFSTVDGMCDLGAIDKVYSMAEKQDDTKTNSFDRAFEMGANVMRRKLHVNDLITDVSADDKKRFYELMMRAGTLSSKGRHLGLGTIMHSSSERMTDWMWGRAQTMCPAFRALNAGKSEANPVNYLDMGAGSGVAARWICKQSRKLHVTCVDVNPTLCGENRHLSDEGGFGSQIDVKLGSFDGLSVDYSNWFDGCFSQDAFHQAFDKLHTFSEAFRVTKGGGWLMISDLLCGDNLSEENSEELQEFGDDHNMGERATPSQCVELAKEAGWSQVEFVDCTSEIKLSLKALLTQVKAMVDSGNYTGENMQLLQTHRLKMSKLLGQADRGLFKWGIIAARKPYSVVYLSQPPVEPDPHPMMNYAIDDVHGGIKFGTDVLVVNIKEKLNREKIMELPSSTRLIVTLSAGLDHIDTECATERGIRIRRAARSQIVKSVADYLLSNIIFGLRNGFQNVGVPFPGASWDLQWNSDGVDLDMSKIGFIGMGASECLRHFSYELLT